MTLAQQDICTRIHLRNNKLAILRKLPFYAYVLMRKCLPSNRFRSEQIRLDIRLVRSHAWNAPVLQLLHGPGRRRVKGDFSFFAADSDRQFQARAKLVSWRSISRMQQIAFAKRVQNLQAERNLQKKHVRDAPVDRPGRQALQLQTGLSP